MSKTNNKTTQPIYDDELDENFIDDVSKTSANELQNISDSFANPQGVEDDATTNVTAGPDIDPEELEKLFKHMESLPRDQLMSLLTNMRNQKDFGLGENDLRSVSENHREDLRNRLRSRVDQKRNARQPKGVRIAQYEREQAKSTLLKEKNVNANASKNVNVDNNVVNDIVEKSDDLDDVDDLDEPRSHVHSASCSHGKCEGQGPVKPLQRQPLTGMRNDGGKRLGELERDANDLQDQEPPVKKSTRKEIRAANKNNRKKGKK